MTLIFAQARFPAPEFENYTLPQMNLESFIYNSVYWRVGLLIFFLLITGLCFYRYRSRKAILILSILGLIVFGFLFTACPCPVGMFQNIVENAVNGTSMHLGLLLLFVLPLIGALFFGRLFCAAACPIGAVQEILHWKTVMVPRPLDRVLRMIPILFLLLFTVMASCGMGYQLCYLEPYLPLFLLSFSFPMACLLFAFLLLGLFISRPFCRYCCPYGVLLRFFTLFAGKQPKITTDKCINCKLCEQGCPNGAIIPPENELSSEIQRTGTRRLSFLVACLPFALFFGGLLGYFSAPVVSYYHRDVQLLRQIRNGEQTDAVKAFESSGTSLTMLEKNVTKIHYHILIGMCLAGIVFSACFMAEMIAEARHRREETLYSIDATLCFCCGRCYPVCPLLKRVPVQKEIKS